MNQSLKTVSIIGLACILSLVLIVGLGGTLLPLLIAFGFAYLSFPLISKIEKRGLPRGVAVAGVFSGVVAFWVLVAFLVLPGLVADGRQFFRELPEAAAVSIDRVEQFANSFGFKIEISKQGLKDFLNENTSAISGDMVQSTSKFLGGLFSNFFRALLFALNLLLIPLFFFHLINQYESIANETRDLVPLPWRPKVKQYVELSNTVLSGYLRGQVSVAAILAVLYATGFTIVGLRFGALIGFATGCLSFIPYVGSIFGFATACAVALANFSGAGPLVGVVIVFIIVQGLEGLVITPKLVGNKVGLGVLSTMLALIIGGNLFGFVGMIIAIPLAAIMKSLLQDLRQEYRKLKFYRG
jgi:predicted PurR-regulated permease PerM